MVAYRPSLLVLVNGTPVRCESVATAHGFDIPIPQGTFVFAGPPHPALVFGATIQALATVGSRNGPIFTGEIRNDDWRIDEGGRTVTVSAEHACWRLGVKRSEGGAWGGGTGIDGDTLVENVTAAAGVRSIRVDRMVDSTGSSIRLGTNTEANPDGAVVDEEETYLDFLARIGEPFGYRGFGLPDGSFRFMKVVADPPISAYLTLAEGGAGFVWQRVRSADEAANHVIVEGAVYRTADGGTRSIRSSTAVPDGTRTIR